jgi:transcriptional regulator with PAS, ATPase and Fis domain
MAETMAEPQKAELLAAVKIGGKYGETPGPLKTAVNSKAFSEIHLLSNYPAKVNKQFANWLGGKTVIHQVRLDNPTDYTTIFELADHFLREVAVRREGRPTELCMHLSPGTPAMAAIWVLLGKSRYPATFYQTHKGQLTETVIPFDLAVDFLPELLRHPDSTLQHLAAKNPEEIAGFERIVGKSQAIRVAVGRAQRAALRDVPVLIVGESGTGKELFARAIHAASHRKSGPFVAINCAAIPRELLESELFGHAKGAFTSAQSDRLGAFQRADGGTLFLDEIGECEPQMQTKLLRVLQPPPDSGPCRREVYPVGASRAVEVDVRVLAATNRELARLIEDRQFREDLYYRLAVITLRLPPLRERTGDIPLLADALLQKINEEFRSQEPGYEHKSLSVAANGFVKRYRWPGNIRQLYNTLVQASVMAEGRILQREDLLAALAEMPENSGKAVHISDAPLGDGFDLEEHLNELRRQYLQRAMEQAGGVKAKAARLLGMKNYQTLDAQLKRLGIDKERSGNRRGGRSSADPQ